MRTEVDRLIDRARGDPNYVAFLLIERPYIRSALLARGTPLDTVDRTLTFPVTIGNAFHDDLIELELWMSSLSPNDRELLERWSMREDVSPAYGRAYVRRVKSLLRDHARQQKERADGEASS
jgi:hypothetical protein